MTKKLYLFALLMVMTACSFAQERYADIKISLLNPESGDLIYPDVEFDINSRVYNLGPDTLRASDSLKFMLFFDGYAVSFGNSGGGMDSFVMMSGQEILPGDSAFFGFKFGIDTSWAGGATTLCTALLPYNVTGNIYDTVLTNNKSCAAIAIYKPTGIKDINAANSVVSIYPNPATAEAFIKLKIAAQAAVSYSVTDVTGRILIQEDKGTLQAGNYNFHINTGQLAPGSYFYQVTINGQVQQGKLLVQ